MSSVTNSLVPIVIQKTKDGERSFDIFSRLLVDRIVTLDSQVNETSAALIKAQMLFLESEKPEEPIHFYINSPGGSVVAGLGIYDTMEIIACPVHTYITGCAASMGSFLAAAGEKGHRYITRSSSHMIHQVSAGNSGQILDMEISMAETKRLNELLVSEYAKNTGKTVEELKEKMNRDCYLPAEESIEYGLADEILNSRKTNKE